MAESDCSFDRSCPEANADPDGGPGAPDGGDGGGEVKLPPECEDPKGAPNCVSDDYGVFVDGEGGDDASGGTKAEPVKTIAAALKKVGLKPRLYVCGEGPYAEHVKLTREVSIYGGFACGTWSYTGTKAKLSPGTPGYALHVEKVASPVVISDVVAVAEAGEEAGASSVSIFVSESEVTLRRVEALAGRGKDAPASGSAPLNESTPSDLKGNTASGATGAAAKTCTCNVHGSSTGGKGGDASQAGENGTSVPLATPAGVRTGAGGSGGIPCGGGLPGPDGAARAGGKGASKLGVLSAQGFEPGVGMDGEAGNPGSGGGGGGGSSADGGGGGGGCGGCGGGGGLGGRGGGASIGLLAFRSIVHLQTVKLTTSAAGNGGDGSRGGGGGDGGGGGGTLGGCGGGIGGNGAGGGGGGGGAGGVSAAIVRAGGSLEGTPEVVLGTKGARGGFGAGGPGGSNVLSPPSAPSGAPGTAGVDGVAEAIVVVDEG